MVGGVSCVCGPSSKCGICGERHTGCTAVRIIINHFNKRGIFGTMVFRLLFSCLLDILIYLFSSSSIRSRALMFIDCLYTVTIGSLPF